MPDGNRLVRRFKIMDDMIPIYGIECPARFNVCARNLEIFKSFFITGRLCSLYQK